jgi:pimeloyl-ACP methyl ester carboxylesterase
MPKVARAALVALVVACMWMPASGFAASYARTTTIDVDGTTMAVDVYEPGARPPRGVAVLAHGWTRTRVRHRDVGRALAEAGIVAVVPDLPNMLDLWGNGAVIVALARALEDGALGLAPVERSSLLLIGTSAGGLATVYAASKLPGLAGWVGLDPVDRTGTGMLAAAKLDAPAIVLLGDASACNLFSSGRSLASSVPRLVRSVKIDGASHCDFESPTNGFCTTMCGGATREKQLEAQRETVLAALELLAISHMAHAGDAKPAGGGEADRPGVASPLQPDNEER